MNLMRAGRRVSDSQRVALATLANEEPPVCRSGLQCKGKPQATQCSQTNGA